MRTFQFSDAKSHKFWSIEVTGTSFTVTYGKVGTAGQTSTKSFATAEKTQAEADKLIKEKSGKGYVEMTAKAPASDEEAIERAVIANPHDLAARSAYADFLTEKGDPRGEFIRVQLALEDPSLSAAERKKFAAKEKDLMAQHKLGDWAKAIPPVGDNAWDRAENNDPSGGRNLIFQGGLLTTINIGRLSVPVARALFRAGPETRFVHNLFVGGLSYDDEEVGEEEPAAPGEPAVPDVPEGVERPAQHLLVRWPQLRFIRRFIWGWPADPTDDYPSCHMDGAHMYDFVKQMPDIEELRISAHVREPVANKLFALKMPRLRVFQLDHGWSFPYEKLVTQPLPFLEEISSHPHGLEGGDKPYLQIKQLKAICAADLPRLRLLRLRNSTVGDAGAKELVSSGKLKTLKVLDLRNGCMSDKGAKLLAECPDFKNLEFFEVSNNALTPAGIKLLEATGVKVMATEQHSQTKYESEDDENEFLWAGDAE